LGSLEDIEIAIKWNPYWASYPEGVIKFRKIDACKISEILNNSSVI
jgi:hypothetical protein